MALGPRIRGIFGPYERHVAEAYRAVFLDIDALADRIRKWAPDAKEILEVGCGEGAVTERLSAAYPNAQITAIDLTPRLGRLYAGPRERVRFLQVDVQEIARVNPNAFDLVIMSDVLHHVPTEGRRALLDAIRRATAANGKFVLKDWERTPTPIHWLCYASDRYITGDAISYLTSDELIGEIGESFGRAGCVDEARIAPWRNNIAILVAP
ncbi:class I SAM-dependent methyltransferase [Methylocystis sp. MJC1]|jgi:2-polyprenyl-6-hydroxyphenyl methylase/3-demethylubiquinone-9 3-methyltransferase|uniref:class I SAM-dependent methyltransferase n=1 Tax=Methylocystis sp. MJC1 TaxID=2654282 RepID=UPI0013EC2817|nr:class I SAM-dependent methyltransferase [Methylocystis sp. MJC1]KAF2991848.1 Ubiquinone biosynthesis O-methyltransferase [Methylocystis sp. MJC1]MBU6528951.1 class I SAM-dependent methyltransferase [Methylocystis sp. MJC1]UZX11834.1 class I SAM-dependent methyltransferase [Methylocystis sp. MJC1]